jgi:hypothetical protein
MASWGISAMWQSIVLGFLAAAFFGNGFPHFVRGITKERYPCVLGGGPIPNLIAGWLSFVVAGILTHWIDLRDWRMEVSISAAAGLLAIGLFHAGPGAFGRK